MDPQTLITLGLGAAMFYGITRGTTWGRNLAIGCFVAILFLQVSAPDDGCYTEWDGRSNPVICD